MWCVLQRFRDRPVQLMGGLAFLCLLAATGLAAYGAVVVGDWLPWLVRSASRWAHELAYIA
eukprot:609927-Pyramimonas_sp.AAC.1